MNLGIDPDELNVCVQCGLCLSSCPTYRVTGDEARSPRGRIGLMRAVQNDGHELTASIRDAFDSCIQCRGCEPACPSGVRYGSLIASTRVSLAAQGHGASWWLRAGLVGLRHPWLLRSGTRLLAVGQRLGMVPKRLPIQRLPLRQRPRTTSGSDVVLFTGCVMDAWQRDVHDAAQRCLERAGFGVLPSGDAIPCCGALHHHAGQHDDAVEMAHAVIDAVPPNTPIIVDSAGCGAAMKEYGELVGPAGSRFASNVYDIHEFLALHIDRLPSLADVEPLDVSVAIQDPCHLRHVQRVHESTRQLLAPVVRELIELDDDGMCCGAGGAYSIQQPDSAGAIAARKLGAIDRADADVVASANPGCSSHLGARGAKVVHPIELLDRALEQPRAT